MSGKVQRQNNKIPDTLNWFKTYWFLFIFLAGIAATWGTFMAKLDNLESRQTRTEVRQEAIVSDISDIQASLSSIETKLEFIIKKLDDL